MEGSSTDRPRLGRYLRGHRALCHLPQCLQLPACRHADRLAPLLTWMMVITRIRNIAEHAVVPDSDDPLRNTRTTTANLFELIFIAPYFVNYHLEHHLLYYVPCYNLPKLHAILM